MNELEISKAKKIRNGLVIISAGFSVVGIITAFYPTSDPVAVRCVSSTLCLVAAILWLLPAIGRVSFSRCLVALVFANFLVLLVLGWLMDLVHKTKWDSIYREVAQLSKAGTFDPLQFGSLLSQTLNSGSMLMIGIVGIWVLNLLALAYLAQTEREKETKKHSAEQNATANAG